MLLKVHAWLEEIFNTIDTSMNGISSDGYKKLQAAFFLLSLSGIGMLMIGMLFHSWLFLSLGIIAYIVPSIWDRVQFFLLTS